MKKILTLFVATCLLLVVPVTHAEDASSPSPVGARQTRQEIREERRDAINEMKTERQELRTEQRSEIKAMRGVFNVARAGARATMLEKKYAFIYDRFNNIITRFEARIKILKDQGYGSELVSTETKLADAKTKLASAKTAADTAITALKAVTADSTKDDFTKINDLVKTANSSYRSVNDALKTALKELKTVSKPALPAASESVTN